MKLRAPSVEAGTWDLVLHPSNLWLTIHESIGHPTELDRALGYEANYAGTSFLAPPDQVLNRFQIGRELMTFMGNRTEEGGCATVGWDDEGVAATAWPIIENGIFVNYQTTREQAAWIADQTGVRNSLGCAYGQYWSSMPFQRMPNVSLMPGAEDLSEEDVIAATDHGILVAGRGSYSIDQQRYNFQFSGQVFWEIRNGRKYQMLRDVAYVARTPDFWAISEFPKWRKCLISLSFRDKSSVRPVQVGGFEANIVVHRSTAVRGRGGPPPPWESSCRTRTGPVEADGTVDAQNAPTAPWKTLRVFHELPQGLSHRITHAKPRKAPKWRWETRIDPISGARWP